MNTVAATYRFSESLGPVQCGASSMTGSRIPTGMCELHPTRHYSGHSRPAKGALYGKIVPEAQRDAELTAAGYTEPYRRMRECGLYWGRGWVITSRVQGTTTGPATPFRRSWRRAIAAGRLEPVTAAATAAAINKAAWTFPRR